MSEGMATPVQQKTQVLEFKVNSAPAGVTGASNGFEGNWNWTIPPGAVSLDIYAVGAGGGGASGQVTGTDTDALGGPGGGAGGVYSFSIPAASCPPVLNVVVGGGGIGGARTNAGLKNTGGQGGTCGISGLFLLYPASGGTGDVYPYAGQGGWGHPNGQHGASSGNGTGADDNARNSGTKITPSSGAGGGNISSVNVAGAGGNSEIYWSGIMILQNSTASQGGAVGANATPAMLPSGFGTPLIGAGGGGGGASTAGDGGNGASAVGYGGGGGGGGAARSGFLSGAGGNGGGALIRITVGF